MALELGVAVELWELDELVVVAEDVGVVGRLTGAGVLLEVVALLVLVTLLVVLELVLVVALLVAELSLEVLTLALLSLLDEEDAGGVTGSFW